MSKHSSLKSNSSLTFLLVLLNPIDCIIFFISVPLIFILELNKLTVPTAGSSVRNFLK